MTMKTFKEKYTAVLPNLLKDLNLKNKLAAPRLLKIVVSVGTGRQKDKKQQELMADRLAKITGQKPALRGAKRSIATFKLRQGDPIGLMVTLRGRRMEHFLDKLLSVTIPRMRDFRGWPETVIDEAGNLTIGIREHTIFPETADEDLRNVFGLAITFVTTAHTHTRGLAFFKAIGFPFRKV